MHSAGDDFTQAGNMVRKVLYDDARKVLVSNVTRHLLNGVSRPVQDRAVPYWRNSNRSTGDKVAQVPTSPDAREHTAQQPTPGPMPADGGGRLTDTPAAPGARSIRSVTAPIKGRGQRSLRHALRVSRAIASLAVDALGGSSPTTGAGAVT
ncbi:catalase-related domain-containing protein [Streptomyces sp. wa1064]|uniref:catalase-related domain-containing protein n=1 Tax=Streptomyces sp. wa1064 TaxID=1828213 RepID=UPI003C7D9E46